MKKNVDEQKKSEATVEEVQRREFLNKFGKLAATVPVGMLVLMGPTQSKANESGSDTIDPPNP